MQQFAGDGYQAADNAEESRQLQGYRQKRDETVVVKEDVGGVPEIDIKTPTLDDDEQTIREIG